MKGPRLIFHAEHELAHPKTTFFFIISPTTVPPRTSSSCCLSLFKEASYTQTTSAEVPVLHTPVEVAEMKMPKARANITVYSTRFSGSSLILSCLTVSFSCGIVYSRVKRTPESEKRRRKYISCLLYTSPSPRD